MPGHILFVDDEFHLLAAIKRQLHKRAEIELASSGEDALRRLKTPARYAALVTDLRMPGVNGITLLKQARATAPDVVRILLTGAIDVPTAQVAVNEAEVYRILTKPVDQAVLLSALSDAVAYNKRLVTERESLEKTQAGALAMLADIMEAACPVVADRAVRLQVLARHIAKALSLQNVSHFEVLGVVSQLGCLTLPGEVMAKYGAGKSMSMGEQAMVDACWEHGARLAAHLPGLSLAAATLTAYFDPRRQLVSTNDIVGLGTQIMRTAQAYDALSTSAVPTSEIIDRLQLDPVSYPPAMVQALRDLKPAVQGTNWVVQAAQLKAGMVFQEDVRARDGALLASRSQQASDTVIERIVESAGRVGVNEPIRVLVPNVT